MAISSRLKINDTVLQNMNHIQQWMWNCGSKLLGSSVTCPSLTDPCLKHLGSGLWSEPAQIPWLAPKHVGIQFRAELWWIKLLPPISSPNHLGSAKNIQSLGINRTIMDDEIPAHDVDIGFLFEVPQWTKIRGLTWSAIPIFDHDRGGGRWKSGNQHENVRNYTERNLGSMSNGCFLSETRARNPKWGSYSVTVTVFQWQAAKNL